MRNYKSTMTTDLLPFARPYYGQFAWFGRFHSEKIPSAVERYQKEVLRVLGVLESVLSKQEWLVGGKMTIADISFVMYVRSHTAEFQRGSLTRRCSWNEWALWAFRKYLNLIYSYSFDSHI